MSGLIWIHTVWHSDGISERNFGKDSFLKKSADDKRACKELIRLAPVSNVNFFSKTDYLSKIAIYKLYLEVEVLNLTIREDRIF